MEVESDNRKNMIDRYWRIAIVAVLFYFLFEQEVQRLFALWATPSESHGLLIPAFSLYFLYQVREKIANVKGRPSLIGFLFVLAFLVCYVASIIMKIGYIKPVSMIFTLAALVWWVSGWQMFKLTWLPILFLIFAIKIPDQIYTPLTMQLRIWASLFAANLLDLIPGVSCESTSVVIRGLYNGEPFELNVADACSGMRLLRTFVALGVAMAWMEVRPAWQRISLLISTMPIAIFCNMLRVLITGLIYIFIGPEYATGTLHSMLGLVTLAVAFGLYGLLTWIMNNFVIDDTDDDSDNEDVVVLGRSEGQSDKR